MATRKNRCINIDWLEVYALEPAEFFPMDATFFENAGYQVRRRDYGTRVYKEMFTLLNWHDEPFIEVRRNPASSTAKDGGLFPPESCHLRLSNRACYSANPIDDLRKFMARFNYELVKIFRIDICMDFVTFDRGDEPAKFIERYMKGKYSKINLSNISAHGVDTWSGRTWNSLSWGQPKSMISTKLYCKSLELQQVHEKPYINMQWYHAGFVDDPINLTKRLPDGTITKPDIYRVEFSIKSSAKKWFVIDKATGKKGKIPMPNTLEVYDNKLKLETVFASLAQHYFHFKYYEEGVRKDRCKDKVLFDFSALDQFVKVDRLASHTSKTKPNQRLIILLRKFIQLNPNPKAEEAIKYICDYIQNIMLKDMAEYGTSQKEILALQQTITARLKGMTEISPQEQIKQLEDWLERNPELF